MLDCLWRDSRGNQINNRLSYCCLRYQAPPRERSKSEFGRQGATQDATRHPNDAGSWRKCRKRGCGQGTDTKLRPSDSGARSYSGNRGATGTTPARSPNRVAQHHPNDLKVSYSTRTNALACTHRIHTCISCAHCKRRDIWTTRM